MARTLRVLQVAPVPERLNPYVYLLARSLEAEGAKCTIWNHFSLRRFLAGRHRVDILHFHWAEHLCSPSRPARTWKDFLQLSIGLVYAKATRCRLVYTVHNLDPHGGTTARVSSMAHRLLLAVADGLHVHDEYSRLRLQERVKGRRPVFPIPHGHYIGAYPNRCSREEARARLGLEGEAFAYLFLGQMRPHKGIEDLVVAFQHIAQGRDRLVLAGWAPQDSYGRLVRKLADGDPRIKVFAQFVADEDIQYFLNGCEVCVLPYRTMTTSGAAILSLSFGKPVIAPRIGGFPCLLEKGGGLLYDPEGNGLSCALAQAREMDLKAASTRAFSLARGLDWAPIARQHLAVYEKLAGRSRAQQC